MKKLFILLGLALLPIVAGAEGPREITVYSGRTKDLAGPIFDKFQKETGIKVNVRYGNTPELAATILEEGKNSPADVYFAQDAGGLGAVAAAGIFRKIPDPLLNRVDRRFRSADGLWVGTSGRVRVAAFNTKELKESDLPDSILGFTDPKWKGKLGWAPTNGSFQACVTAMRLKLGDDATAKWLKEIQANQPKVFQNNHVAVTATGVGEVQVSFVNHYYLLIVKKEKGDSFPVANHYFKKGDVGSLVNVAGVGLLKTGKNPQAAEKLVDYLLSPDAQQYFISGGEENEYAVVTGIPNNPILKPLKDIESPDIDLSKLTDLKGTQKLLRDAGVLE